MGLDRSSAAWHLLRLGSLLAGCVTAVVVAGCNVGPDSVARDRVDYGDALARSGREELLRNVVRLRYLESPVFLSVNSVVNQYAIEGTVNGGVNWGFGPTTGAGGLVGAQTTFADRPTITYSPLTGQRFATAYLRPVPVSSVLSLVQSGYRVDFLFPLLVDSINLHRNGFHAGRVDVPTDPEFTRVIQTLSTMQDLGEFHIRARVDQTSEPEIRRDFMVFDPDGDPKAIQRLAEFEVLLGIPKEARRVEIRPGSAATSDEGISISTKSLLRIISNLSIQVDVPQDAIDRGMVRVRSGDGRFPGSRLRIHSGPDRPERAYVAIEHRGDWYWIDENDLDSKEIFLWVLMLSNLTDGASGRDTPVLTIPAG